MPMAQRRNPILGPDHLNSGNYLLGAIANRWISRLTYVYPADREIDAQLPPGRRRGNNQGPSVSDIPPWIFKNDDWKTETIQLKHDAVTDRGGPGEELAHTEPPVPFTWLEDREFNASAVTHLFLAYSPEYTPVEADELLPIIREYFYRA